jgi:hypothetical protein
MIIEAREATKSSSSRTLVRITCLSAGAAVPSRKEFRTDDNMLEVRILLLRGIEQAGRVENDVAAGVCE